MTGWVLYALFLVVGIGMLIGGIYYLRKEKDDQESVSLYRKMSILGVAVAIVSTAVRVVTML